MTRISISLMVTMAVLLAVLGGRAPAAQDKSVKVPDGFGFADFKGYENWQAVGPSLTDAQHVIRLILASPTMIQAYRDGAPGNGKPFPEGSKIVKIEWTPKILTDAPFSASTPDTVPGALHEVEFIQKDSKRFADSNNGWGYAAFDYDESSNKFTPIGTGYKCGTACHTLAKAKDFIFTAYPKR
jgi:Cytochrome P460